MIVRIKKYTKLIRGCRNETISKCLQKYISGYIVSDLSFIKYVVMTNQ